MALVKELRCQDEPIITEYHTVVSSHQQCNQLTMSAASDEASDEADASIRIVMLDTTRDKRQSLRLKRETL